VGIHRSSAAYDLERFATADLGLPARVRQPVQLHVVKTARSQTKTRAARRTIALSFVLILLVVAGILYNNALLTETTSQIEVRRQYLSALQNENLRMMVELENRLPLREIQRAAQSELGMAKTEEYQIMYIDLGGSDGVCVFNNLVPTAPQVILGKLKPILQGIRP
jgi:hypothetical protein